MSPGEGATDKLERSEVDELELREVLTVTGLVLCLIGALVLYFTPAPLSAVEARERNMPLARSMSPTSRAAERRALLRHAALLPLALGFMLQLAGAIIP